MNIQSRGYELGDYDDVQQFLFDLFTRANSIENWFPERFENSHQHNIDHIQLWERIDGTKPQIVGIANPDSMNEFYLQIDPQFEFLENEMIKWIGNHYQQIKKKKSNILNIIVLAGNDSREAKLKEEGFEKDGTYGYMRIRQLDHPIPEYVIPDGYRVRSLECEDFDQICSTIRLVFGHGEWFNKEVYESIASCSFYIKDLDLVMEAEDGTFASFLTYRVDPLTRIASLEPMGTHPNHRRKGLGKILIYEGTERALKYNPTMFHIGGAADTPAANKLYDSTGYTEKYAYHKWIKKIL